VFVNNKGKEVEDLQQVRHLQKKKAKENRLVIYLTSDKVALYEPSGQSLTHEPQASASMSTRQNKVQFITS
jgi:hypothetical protein